MKYENETEANVYRNILDSVIRYNLKAEKNTKKYKKLKKQFCAILVNLAYYLQICYQLCILK